MVRSWQADLRMVAAAGPTPGVAAAGKCHCHLLFSGFHGYVKPIFSVWIHSVREEKVQSRSFCPQCLTGSIWQQVATGLLHRWDIHQLSATFCCSTMASFSLYRITIPSFWLSVICGEAAGCCCCDLRHPDTCWWHRPTLFPYFTYAPPNQTCTIAPADGEWAEWIQSNQS